MVEEHITAKVYREVLVVPLAARREALALTGAILLIMLLMGIRFFLLSSDIKEVKTLPAYQVKDITLKNQAPILYRSLLSTIADIQDLRDESGKWPTVAELKDEALPPFASNFLPVGLRGFHWTGYIHQGWVDYYGINKDVGSEEKQGSDPLENSFILRIIDLQSTDHPHPHIGRDNDSTTRYTAQVWMNPQSVDYPAAALIAKGWKWLVQPGFTPGGDGEASLVEDAAK